MFLLGSVGWTICGQLEGFNNQKSSWGQSKNIWWGLESIIQGPLENISWKILIRFIRRSGQESILGPFESFWAPLSHFQSFRVHLKSI